MNKEQRLKLIAKCAYKVQAGKVLNNASLEKAFDSFAGMIIQSETVKSGKLERFDELNFN
jgi:hypothetical protein